MSAFAEGEVDRSPTAPGVSARMALHHAPAIGIGQKMVIESIIGSSFRQRGQNNDVWAISSDHSRS